MTMLTIGFIMGETDMRRIFCRDLGVITVLRLGIQPLIVLGVCYLLHLEPLVAEVITASGFHAGG
ncbi:MAG: hypothetical protein V8Q40_07395 [Anaerosacchariphilus sp.]